MERDITYGAQMIEWKHKVRVGLQNRSFALEDGCQVNAALTLSPPERIFPYQVKPSVNEMISKGISIGLIGHEGSKKKSSYTDPRRLSGTYRNSEYQYQSRERQRMWPPPGKYPQWSIHRELKMADTDEALAVDTTLINTEVRFKKAKKRGRIGNQSFRLGKDELSRG
ncbi:hypothetical protein RJZ90_003803 [Blastomyces dermatitidis]